MQTIELFCGTKSFSKVAEKNYFDTFTVDNDSRHKPDLCADILRIDISRLPKGCFILWASPPCTTFSVASIGKHWDMASGILKPKSVNAEIGLKILSKTVEIIAILKPKFWFIENPRAMMRVVIPQVFKDFGLHYDLRATVTYCQYGDTRMKPTDIWTNCIEWEPRPMCHNGAKCHEPAPRGTKQGTQGLKNDVERGIVPKQLCQEIIETCIINGIAEYSQETIELRI
jgi:hypothetical protein